jgi:hypothetical protein
MDTNELVTTIDQRLDQAQVEIARLQAAREKLLNGTAAPRAATRTRRAKPSAAKPRSATPGAAKASTATPPAVTASTGTPSAAKPSAAKPATVKPRRTKAKARARRAKPTGVVPAGVLERILGEHDGLTTAQLAEQANGNRDQVLMLLRELEASERVRRTGQRRGTRWHRLTEEDLIAERAAELASRSRNARS